MTSEKSSLAAVGFSAKFVLFSLAFAACSLLCAYAFYSCNGDELAFVSADEQTADIVIDAGHGGMDGGASTADGIPESGLNLAVALCLRDFCTVTGRNAVMTREDDIMLDDGGRGSNKSKDLRARLNISDANISTPFVSIHMNKFPSESCRGLQVWYSPNSPDSFDIAQNIQSAAKTLLDGENDRQIKKATSAIYLLDRAKAPAVLVECGFLSSPVEAKLLTDGVYRQKLAMVIFNGIFNETLDKNLM